jgi:8-oxo-dGTP pyrophosphatase MutT (NUDIX family)
VSSRHDDRHAALLAALARHEPADPVEARSLRRTRALVAWLPTPFDEHADPTHVTGSAIVCDGRGRVVLHRHKRLGIWLQPGGHVDPGESPAAGAARETLEETGLRARHPDGDPQLLHVDVHPGPRGHLHLDLRYLLLADPDAALTPATGESPDVAWFTVAQAQRLGDHGLVAAIRAAGRAVGSA